MNLSLLRERISRAVLSHTIAIATDGHLNLNSLKWSQVKRVFPHYVATFQVLDSHRWLGHSHQHTPFCWAEFIWITSLHSSLGPLREVGHQKPQCLEVHEFPPMVQQISSPILYGV